MVKFSPRVGIDGRDMAAFNDRVIRQQFFARISDRCANMKQSIRALQRRHEPNPQPFLSLHREICQIGDTLKGIRKHRLAVPEGLELEVDIVKTQLVEILIKLGVSYS